MIRSRQIKIILLLITLSASVLLRAGNVEPLLKKGWAALVKDNDTAAIACFERAYEAAVKEHDIEHSAEAQLDLGICYYGVSQSKGLEYCFAAMAGYKKLESSDPLKALQGRSRCLQLVSTIYARQKKYRESIALSREALRGFPEKDSNGYRGLAYSTIGSCYAGLKQKDSAEYYHRRALQAQLDARNFVYLPGAYVKVADAGLEKGDLGQSLVLYRRSLAIADSTQNRQAVVTSWLGLGKWQQTKGNSDSAGFYFNGALERSKTLSDKAFYLASLGRLLEFRKQQGRFEDALALREEMVRVSDQMSAFDREKLVKDLQVQFEVTEKDRQLQLMQQEKDIATLSNYLLWGTIVAICSVAAAIIIFLRRSNQRNKLLLSTKEALVQALEEQKRIREQYLQNEIEFKESQLSAMALQMLQKNELMQDLKQQLEGKAQDAHDHALQRLINKGLNHDKEWSDFNAYFESVNRNFYSRLKEDYPEISPNDLKICALIRLNLSIKEMAGILNISPDSVKTARYRLRKKLQLATEDNLTEFILKL